MIWYTYTISYYYSFLILLPFIIQSLLLGKNMYFLWNLFRDEAVFLFALLIFFEDVN